MLAHLHCFLSYFYVEIIDQKVEQSDIRECDLQDFKDYLNSVLTSSGSNGVSKVELHMKSSIMFYQEKLTKFLKIYVSLPKYISHLRDLFNKEVVLWQNKSNVFSDVTYDSSLPFNLRFMIDKGVNGMSWINIPKG